MCLIAFSFRMVLLNYFIIISKVVPRAQRYVTGLMYLIFSLSLNGLGPCLRSPDALSAGLGVLLLSPVIFWTETSLFNIWHLWSFCFIEDIKNDKRWSLFPELHVHFSSRCISFVIITSLLFSPAVCRWPWFAIIFLNLWRCGQYVLLGWETEA